MFYRSDQRLSDGRCRASPLADNDLAIGAVHGEAALRTKRWWNGYASYATVTHC